METLSESHNVNVVWRSFELRPEGAPPVPDWYRQKIEASRPQFIQMAKAHYGIDIQSGPWGINSRPALVGAKYAEAQGKGDAYHDAVFRAYWQDAKNIEDKDVLQEIAVNIGLDGEEFLVALGEPKWEDEVSTDVQIAHHIGITGVPGLLFKEKYFLSGAQPYEELVKIVNQIREREGDNA